MSSTGELAKALAAFQAEMPTVAKSHTATVRSDKGSYSYDYADLADVTEAAMPLLTKHGLSFSCCPNRTESGHYELTGLLLHQSGESVSGSLPIQGGTPQQLGSAITYMRRYLFGCMTGLVTDSDDDGAAASAPAKKKPVAKKASPEQLDELGRLFDAAGITDRGLFIWEQLGSKPAPADLTVAECHQLIAALKAVAA